MEEFKSRVLIDLSAVNHFIALTTKQAPGVEKVYALKDDKLDSKYNRFIKTKKGEEGISTYIAVKPDYSLSQEETTKSISQVVKKELYLSMGLKLENIDILYL